MSPAREAALRAMAQADESPHERDIARAKLDAAGVGWREPPRRPPAAPAPGADDFDEVLRRANRAFAKNADDLRRAFEQFARATATYTTATTSNGATFTVHFTDTSGS